MLFKSKYIPFEYFPYCLATSTDFEGEVAETKISARIATSLNVGKISMPDFAIASIVYRDLFSVDVTN